jgi:hypothetical protein
VEKPITTGSAAPDLQVMTDAIMNSPTLRLLDKHLDRLAISADAKALLRDLARLSLKVGEAALNVGRRIVGFILDLARRFPNTAFGVIVGVVITLLIAAVPFIGPFLAGFLGPLMIAFGIAVGALRDMGDAELRSRVSILEGEFRTINPTAGG